MDSIVQAVIENAKSRLRIIEDEAEVLRAIIKAASPLTASASRAKPNAGRIFSGSVSDRILSAVGNVPIGADQVSKKIGVSTSLVSQELSRMAKRGHVVRVCRGQYKLP